MATPHPPQEPAGPERRSGLTQAQKWTLGGIGALVVLLVLVVVLVAGEDDDAATTTTSTDTTTTTTPEETTPEETSEPSAPTTTPFVPAVDRFDVAFPSPEHSRSFEAPAAAARAYATEVLGFDELVLAAPTAVTGGTEVVVQPDEEGPETRIQLVQVDEAWYVIGSTTDDITVREPAPGTSLASPFQTTGDALAFEGAVEVLVLTQADLAPVGAGTVTGSGVPPAGPFAGDVAFTPPPEPTPGILVYRISSAEDGRVLGATSVRVRLTNLTRPEAAPASAP
jgi:hypothetical protein